MVPVCCASGAPARRLDYFVVHLLPMERRLKFRGEGRGVWFIVADDGICTNAGELVLRLMEDSSCVRIGIHASLPLKRKILCRQISSAPDAIDDGGTALFRTMPSFVPFLRTSRCGPQLIRNLSTTDQPPVVVAFAPAPDPIPGHLFVRHISMVPQRL
mmetsp:Transcript_25178/g.58187  ORF Transcript_25178/g.58187 Transcript_25178/m.58187 type:complete len:158 (-) Transcript_25178:302-775(-)